MSAHRRSGIPPLNRIEHRDAVPGVGAPTDNAAGRRIYDCPREFGYFRPEDAVGNVSGNLPHWRQEGVTYFVTFRLADALPQVKLQGWLRERDVWLASHPRPWDARTSTAYHKRFTARIEKWLDAGYGSCALALNFVLSWLMRCPILMARVTNLMHGSSCPITFMPS